MEFASYANDLADFYKNRYLWMVSFFVLGGIFLLIALVYFILTYKELCHKERRKQMEFFPQIIFLCAVFIKGVGNIFQGLFYVNLEDTQSAAKNYELYDRYSVLTSGLPGYVIALAYITIFLSWCKICNNYLENEAKSFFKWAERICYIMIIAIGIVFVGSTIVIVSNGKGQTREVAHNVEAICACIRDVLIALCFLVYMKSISKLLECKFPDIWISIKCGLLLFVLVLRAVSITLYTFYFDTSRFSKQYFVLFLIEQFLSEVLPLSFIAFMRLAPCTVTNTQTSHELYVGDYADFEKLN